jgi:hypothetical protein
MSAPLNKVPLEPADLLDLDKARNRLAGLWIFGVGLFIVILVFQSLLNRYDDKVQDVWGWALPTILPTLAMIITVLGYTALVPSTSGEVVRRSFFWIAYGLSAFYLFLVLVVVLVQPFQSPGSDPVNAMHLSNLWLGPIQGLVASALGVLFVSKRKRGE